MSFTRCPKKIKGLKYKKTMQCNKLPQKVIISGAATVCTHFAVLINICIQKSVLPSELKLAEITHLYKKGDIYDKGNYRPDGVLPCVSKLFEGVLIDQLQCHFNPLLFHHMSGFRKGHSC